MFLFRPFDVDRHDLDGSRHLPDRPTARLLTNTEDDRTGHAGSSSADSR